MSLAEICERAAHLKIPIDPDGLIEDREDIINSKLKVHQADGTLKIILSPALIETDYRIYKLLRISIVDLYNYLLPFAEYDINSLRDYTNMEGYAMQKDGYVIDLQSGRYESHPNVFGVVSRKRPRTREVDPITKMKYYNVWILMSDGDGLRILAAYCGCKGG